MKGGGGPRGPCPPNRRLTVFLREKTCLCWDVKPALFSKVTLVSLSVGLKNTDSAAGGAQLKL